MRKGFDNEKYSKIQSEKILERIKQFGGKLYMEFGGKLFDDFHATRVLPGFEPDSKMKMLLTMKDSAEIIIAINANDIERNKVRGDYGITYDSDTLRLIDAFFAIGLYVGSVVITQYKLQPKTLAFEKRLKSLGITVYKHYTIEDYPSNVNLIVSDEGYGKNEYIQTKRPLVVVTAPGPGSGKMATCLSQLYHDHKRGISSGYAKFETFPIWNKPLKHPVNLAYEAATADLNDINMIDPYHLAAYGVTAVNYNRDIEIFPVLNTILERIMGESPYKSPTDMGVNMIASCIIDDDAICEASKQEVVRRYYAALCNQKKGLSEGEDIFKLEMLLKQLGISGEYRKVVNAALLKQEQTNAPAAAIELPDQTIMTGKTSSLLGAASAMLLNALKHLANIDDDITLISPSVIEPIQNLKVKHLGNTNPRLHLDEVLIALSMCAVTDKYAACAMAQLSNLKGSEVHSTTIMASVDENVLSKLGIHLTCEPVYQTKKLYHKI